MSTAATLYRQLPYDTKQAFAPVGLITDAPMTIIARSDFEPNTLGELVAYLKSRAQDDDGQCRRRLGVASVRHAVHVGDQAAAHHRAVSRHRAGDERPDRQADRHGCDQATNTTGPILGKQVKAYAVTTKARLKTLPDVPTADEAGLKGFELDVWHGLFAPKGTPPAIVQKLSAALKAALKEPDLMKRFNDISTDAGAGGPRHAGGRAAHAGERDRPLGADHQGRRPVRGLGTQATQIGNAGSWTISRDRS